MKIMISGGTGLIGQQLVAELLKKGHEVWVLSSTRTENHNLPGAYLIGWDGSSLGKWSEYVDQMDVIINLAGANIGSKRWAIKRKRLIVESRVKAGKILTEAIKKSNNQTKVFIQASAIGFYDKNRPEILNEQNSGCSDFMGGICKDWEASSLEVESLGIRRIIIRTGIVLSKQDGILNRMMLPFKFFIGGPIGNGNQILSWIHIDDEVSAIQFLLENENAKGVFNLTAPYPASNSGIGKKLAKIMNRPYWIPAPAIFLRFFLGEMSSLVLDGQNIFPQRLLEAGYSFKFEKIDDALTDLLV